MDRKRNSIGSIAVCALLTIFCTMGVAKDQADVLGKPADMSDEEWEIIQNFDFFYYLEMMEEDTEMLENYDIVKDLDKQAVEESENYEEIQDNTENQGEDNE